MKLGISIAFMLGRSSVFVNHKIPHDNQQN